MTDVKWEGVMPAITTPFNEDGSVDHVFLAEHANWMLDAGCTGMVPLGSLGEGATLDFDEKLQVLPRSAGESPGLCAESALPLFVVEVFRTRDGLCYETVFGMNLGRHRGPILPLSLSQSTLLDLLPLGDPRIGSSNALCCV